MNRFPFTLVALAATYTLGSSKKLTAYTDSTGVAMLSIDNAGTDASAGGGGTEQQVKTDLPESNSNVISDSTGANAGINQMQAQASDTSQVGGQTLEAKKSDIDDTSELGGTDAGKQAIGDPSAGQAQQV